MAPRDRDNDEQGSSPKDGHTDDTVSRLAMVAHELRGPVSVVHQCLYLLDRELRATSEMPHRIQTLLDRLQRNTALVARIIGDLLEVVRTDIGSLPLKPQTVDLMKLAGEVVASLGDSDRERTKLMGPATADARCDPDRMAQVVSNLVRNALQHSEGPVDVTIAGSDGAWNLTVENDGDISPDLADDLFRPFVRGATGQGLGLGLYLVRRLVEAHGGTATCRAQDNRVCFMVVLPRN